jgi:hypothetical protein
VILSNSQTLLAYNQNNKLAPFDLCIVSLQARLQQERIVCPIKRIYSSTKSPAHSKGRVEGWTADKPTMGENKASLSTCTPMIANISETTGSGNQGRNWRISIASWCDAANH